jgi:chromosome segregation protein
VEGIASSLVSYEPCYADIMRNLLGRCVVIDNMDSAVRVAKKYKYRFRIVTLDGQIINAGGSMTGGSVSRGSGILSRKNELKKLSVEISEAETGLSHAEEKYAEAEREAAGTAYELEVLSGQLREAEDAVLTLRTQKEHNELSVGARTADIEAFASELASIASRLGRNESDITLQCGISEQKEALAEECMAKIQELGLGQEDLSGRTGELSERIAALKTEAAGYEAEKSAAEKSLEELSALREDIHGDRQRRLELTEQYRLKEKELTEEISEITSRLESLSASREEKKEKLKSLGEKRMEIEAERARAEKQAQEKTACCWTLSERGRGLSRGRRKRSLRKSRSLTGCGSITR